jgi:hypothetical protein
MTSKEESGKRHSARWLLVLLAILPVLLLIGREIVWGGTIGTFRIVDLADLFILAPIYLLILLYLFFRMLHYGAPNWLLALYLVSAFIFMYGHAIHFTGNSLHTYITEVKDYEHEMPEDVFEMIYFLDEEFSHWVLFIGVTGLISSWLLYDQLVKAPPVLPDTMWLILPFGVMYGFVLAYTLIEARSLEFTFLILSIPAITWIYLWRRSGQRFMEFARSRPFTKLVSIMLFSMLIGLGLWFLVFGGFPQPSEVGL